MRFCFQMHNHADIRKQVSSSQSHLCDLQLHRGKIYDLELADYVYLLTALLVTHHRPVSYTNVGARNEKQSQVSKSLLTLEVPRSSYRVQGQVQPVSEICS